MGLWAVHIHDGVLTWPWLVGGFLGALALCWLGMRRLREEEIARIAVMSSAFFVASLIHVPTLAPTSVHLLLNGLVGVLLGPRSAMAILLALFLQAVLLGHGGLTSLGVNTCVMALPALGAWAVFVSFLRWGWLLHPAKRWLLGFLIGGLTVLATAALNAVTLWLGSGEPLDALAVVVFLAHLPVAGVEALVMAATINFLARVKPEMLGLTLPAMPEAVTPQRQRQAG
ncbi:MAG: cobalt transporter CbiM [Gemmatales bacterium]|nr:cobalt transporter CbiM [Gemmatales bacterium]MDW8388219.1 cobalt transporter CbiM [Gemmatales bacterium]